MNDRIIAFLNRLDETLRPFCGEGEYFDMYHLGRSALALHYGFPLTTTDIDIVARSGDSKLERKAIEIFGKNTDMAKMLGLYLDSVPELIPPVPYWFRDRCVQAPGVWQVIRLWKLEIHDLAVTKLKIFRPQDQQDLRALCDAGLLQAAKLFESLDAAFSWRSPKEEDAETNPDDPDWTTALANFKRVEKYLSGELPAI